MLCDNCRKNQATVFVTKIVDEQTSKLRLCAECARTQALSEGWIEGLSGDEAAQFGDASLEEIVMKLFAAEDDAREASGEDDDEEKWSLSELAKLDAAGFVPGEFSGDEDAVDAWDELENERALEDEAPSLDAEIERAAHGSSSANYKSKNPFDDDDDELEEAPRAARPIPVARCPKCETTWDRLRQDGRVGCAACYSAFAEQINEVVSRLQNAQQHIGKAPRAATKRRRRLEHLRARRDHRLTMLNERLRQALDAQNYEEAAKLRDKIKIVESTIVSKDES